VGKGFYERNPATKGFEGRLLEMRTREQLLRGAFWALRDVRKWRGMALWTFVGAITGHGSGYSQQICEELGWDYEMKITPTARLPQPRESQSDAEVSRTVIKEGNHKKNWNDPPAGPRPPPPRSQCVCAKSDGCEKP
jgi:hypothetical protein